MAECPTCDGTGNVPAHVAEALSRPETSGATGNTCWCDGPAHPYSRGWCPRSGPVVR